MKTFYFLIVLLFPLLSLAQQPEIEIERMKKALTLLENDTIIVDTLNEIAYQYRNINPDSAIAYANDAASIANPIDYKKGIADSHNRLGTAFMKKGILGKAKFHFEEAAHLRVQLENYIGASFVYNNLGNLEILSNPGKGNAIFYFLEGLKVIQPLPSAQRWNAEAMLSINLGYAYILRDDYEEALEVLEKGLEIALENNSAKREAAARLNLGIFYRKMNNNMQAREQLLKSLNIYGYLKLNSFSAKCYNELGNLEFNQGNYVNALENYERALNLDGLTLYEEALIYNNQGIIYAAQGKTQLALEQYKQSLEFFTTADNKRQLAKICFGMGSLFLTQSETEKSILYLKQALKHLEGIQAPDIRSEILYHLSLAYSEQNITDTALIYSQQNMFLLDSLYQEKENALTLNVNMKTAQSAMAKMESERARQKNQQIIIFGGAAFLLVFLLLLLALAGLLINRQKRLIAEQHEDLAYQEVNRVLKEAELETTYAWLEGQEEMRKKVGQDLHDRIGSMLSTLKLYFSAIDEKVDQLKEDNKGRFQKVNALIDETVDEVRRISHDMVSVILTKFGLKAQLEEMARRIQNTGTIEVELNIFGMQERLDGELEIKIYRVIQELVSNALKFSKASLLIIQLNRFDKVINIMVEDNGIGFNLEKAEAKGGLGLKSVRSRIHDLNGSISIDTDHGKGTTISIDIECE